MKEKVWCSASEDVSDVVDINEDEELSDLSLNTPQQLIHLLKKFDLCLDTNGDPSDIVFRTRVIRFFSFSRSNSIYFTK